MNRTISVFALALLALAVMPAVAPAHALTVPQVSLSSQYSLNRYGYATVNFTVTAKNNGTGAVVWPGDGGVSFGVGSLGANVFAANVTSGYHWSSPSSGMFTVTGGSSFASGSSSKFSLMLLLSGVTTAAANKSLVVAVLAWPSASVGLYTLQSSIALPTSTLFMTKPTGFKTTVVAANYTYTRTLNNVTESAASVASLYVNSNAGQDFHPLDVYYATRVVSVSSGGNPTVTDTISFKNLGTTSISTLYVAPLITATGRITIQPSSEPPTTSPYTTATLPAFGIDLTNNRVGYPIAPGANYTVVYTYSLAQGYYSVSGGTVTVNIPYAPPIPTFVRTYTMKLQLPSGVNVAQSGPTSFAFDNESPLRAGALSTSYSLSAGWALPAAVPYASIAFVVVLLGLFVSKATASEEEESEEKTSTDRASAMIKAFEDKTSLINSLLAEIPGKDPNERNKAYFDELRSRLDAYRGRALQRLNEVKQKSTTQRFFDILNQLHSTEREVDRAAKDTLNLYEQFYTNRMRKEVFDRLLPSYTKRLEKALDQLMEELHVAQREAKLL